MNPDVKAQWVAALRSGEYEQAHGYLKVVDEGGGVGYCCLGVLCELMPGVERTIKTRAGSSIPGYFGDHSYLPPEVREWAGLAQADPLVSVSLGEESRRFRLSDLNDEEQYSFAEIADVIEAQL